MIITFRYKKHQISTRITRKYTLGKNLMSYLNFLSACDFTNFFVNLDFNLKVFKNILDITRGQKISGIFYFHISKMIRHVQKNSSTFTTAKMLYVPFSPYFAFLACVKFH